MMPPRLLTDDEAVAMAVGLRLAATRQLTDGADTTIRALAKLERVLPAALRERVDAPSERHWYLLCWDLYRDGWRTFVRTGCDRVCCEHACTAQQKR
ncbi:hypothetical protein ACGFI3_43840 [Nonomuraea wenchangensis]|uniref:hypothetical protein n=1 Tax=Nonomuraea wenchangensis TaxID=568860 RepID=UPI0037147663